MSRRGPSESVDEASQLAQLAGRLRDQLGPVRELARWPSVSIVVPNRNGAVHLGTLLGGLADATSYPDMELIVVDNGSSDGSQDLVRGAELPCAVTLIENDRNASFSDAIEQGLNRARGELVLCLNNDVELFEPGWLAELVACRYAHGDAVVAATLLSAPDVAAVQHRGIRFRRTRGRVTAYNAMGPPVGDDVECPAVTAACLLADRRILDRAGGFCSAYWYGSEDVDLGLTLTSSGVPAVCSGRSVVLHRESSTRRLTPRGQRAVSERLNRRYLDARWGATVERAYRLDRLTGTGFFTDGAPMHLGVVVDAYPADGDSPLGDALAAAGFRVSLLGPAEGVRPAIPGDLDGVVVVDPAHAHRVPAALPLIALLSGWDESWRGAELLERAELVLTRCDTSRQQIEQAGRHPLDVAVGADDAAVADVLRIALHERARRASFVLSGSHAEPHAALAGRLRRALEARGHLCYPHTADASNRRADVIVQLTDEPAREPAPGQLTVRALLAGAEPLHGGRYDAVLDWRASVPDARECAGTLARLSRERLQIAFVGPPHGDQQPTESPEWVQRRRMERTLSLQVEQLREAEAQKDREQEAAAQLRTELDELGAQLRAQGAKLGAEQEAAAQLRAQVARQCTALEQLERRLLDEQQLAQQAVADGRELRRVLGAVHLDVQRAAATRGWRIGHAITRLGARLMFRRPRRQGTLERALERLQAIEPTAENLSETPAG